eukprot:1212656-Amphidinium_carterae.1
MNKGLGGIGKMLGCHKVFFCSKILFKVKVSLCSASSIPPSTWNTIVWVRYYGACSTSSTM